jgi:transposase
MCALLGHVGADRLYGHIKKRKSRVEFSEFCRYIRSLYPVAIRRHFILDNLSPHHGQKMREWAAHSKVELEYTPPTGLAWGVEWETLWLICQMRLASGAAGM